MSDPENRLERGVSERGDALEMRLAARPPFAGRVLCDFLRARAIAGVEAIEDGVYRRTVAIGGTRGWVTARVEEGKRPGVKVTMSAELGAQREEIAARVRRLFDLEARPEVIAKHLGGDGRLKAAIAREPGRRVPGAFDGFEVAVRTILGQQVSVAAATTLCGRLVARFGDEALTPWPALARRFPAADTLAACTTAALAAIGLPAARADAIRALAGAVASGAVTLAPTETPAVAMAALEALPGIGPWTASYLAMRVLGWADGFPSGDLVIRRVLDVPNARAAEAATAAWRPWRAYACMHLWAQAAGGG